MMTLEDETKDVKRIKTKYSLVSGPHENYGQNNEIEYSLVSNLKFNS